MDEPKSIAESMRDTLEHARLRILIVGAGIAGATLAALLRQRGEHPVIIERQPKRPGRGYMLGLLPLGGRVLHGLGLHSTYLEQSCPARNYEMYDRRGRLQMQFSLEKIIDRFGDNRGIERGTLVNILRAAGAPDAYHYESEVTQIEEVSERALVTFQDDSKQSFDLVVIADGLHSHTRKLVFPPDEIDFWKTGWGGWVYWLPPLRRDDDTYRELWSAGWGLGLYPVPNRLGIIVAGPVDKLEHADVDAHVSSLRTKLPQGPFQQALEGWEQKEGGFFWELEDCAARHWHTKRVVLLGDAGAGFLPTAGVGASMAMDSAAALADELSRAESHRMEYSLNLYERRQRKRVELAQSNSRTLARLMFLNSSIGAFVRDQAMRFYTGDRLIADISRVMEGR